MTIYQSAVIGAGTMGSQIAAHMANAGVKVLLLDIVPKGADDRSTLAKKALEKLKQSGRAFTHPRHADKIIPGNLEDDLHKLNDAGWIVEAVVEDAAIKRDLYRQLNEVRKDGVIISSNTSTIPLAQLKEGLDASLQRDLCITHFFNPPRQMQLLECITDSANDNAQLGEVMRFIERYMGKTVVYAKDTPGFIANRIGLFWAMWGLEQALAQNIPIELADGLLGKPLGFPKTGIFGLMDLIGLDLMLDITRSLQDNLPEHDPYHRLDASVSLLKDMVDNGQTGMKGGGGFYRKGDHGKQVFDLTNRHYRAISTPKDEAIRAAKSEGLRATLCVDSPGGVYAKSILSQVFRYSASLIPEIADDIVSLDTALKLGLNWERGPFELIDALGTDESSGATWLEQQLKQDGSDVPPLLAVAAKKSGFYTIPADARYYLTTEETYQAMNVPEDRWKLAEITHARKPVVQNEAGRLWDIDDGIACLELTTKMDIMDHATFEVIEQTIDKVQRDFKGLIIGDDDRHFSAGLNLRQILQWCEQEDWQAIEGILQRGQNCWMKLKYAPFPVVGCAYGKAIGGACELLLHCDCIQAHIESQIGLVETNIGVVPSWGGCKEMLWHHLYPLTDPASLVQAGETVFRLIAGAKTSNSAEEAREMRILRDCCQISMHRDRVLAEAKALCLERAEGYEPPAAHAIALPKASLKAALESDIDRLKSEVDTHHKRVLQCLAFVLSGGASIPEITKELDLSYIEARRDDSDIPVKTEEQPILDLERKAFMALVQSQQTQNKIKAVL